MCISASPCLTAHRNQYVFLKIILTSAVPPTKWAPEDFPTLQPWPAPTLTCMKNHAGVRIHLFFFNEVFQSKYLTYFSFRNAKKHTLLAEKPLLSSHTHSYKARHLLHNSDPIMEHLQGQAKCILVLRFFQERSYGRDQNYEIFLSFFFFFIGLRFVYYLMRLMSRYLIESNDLFPAWRHVF